MAALLQTAALMGAFAAVVYAHGHVTGIVADDTYYQGYDPSFQYQQTPPKVVGWSDPQDLGNGFIAPSAYGTPDIICHLDATPGLAVAKVAAGGKVDLQWTAPWPDSHHGPVLDYLAKCAGDDCTTADKASLEFFKIGAVGLVDDSTVPGTWGSDQLIANNNTWTASIPKDIAPGQYVLRHEIIALHSAGNPDGAQNYPQCVNIDVTGFGSATPSGVVGTKLYASNAPGLVVNIYQSLSSYHIPGPTIYLGAVSVAQPTSAASSAAATAAAPASTAPLQGYSSAATPSAASSTTTESSAQVTSAAVATATETTECTSTVTIKTSVTATAAVTATPSVYTAPTVLAAAAVSALASVVPNSALTATISTALPSPAAYGNSASSGSAAPDAPSKPLPAGFTLRDLLEWVAYLLGKAIKEGSSVHARDFRRR